MKNSKPQILARWLHRATIFFMLAIPTAIALVLLTTPITPDLVDQMTNWAPVSPAATQIQLWASIALSAVNVGVFLLTLNEMRKLFHAYALGEVLTVYNAQTIQRIGYYLLGLAVVAFLLQPIQSVLLTWANPEGMRSLTIGFSSDMIGAALAAGLMIVIGWAMRDASEIVAENRAFV